MWIRFRSIFLLAFFSSQCNNSKCERVCFLIYVNRYEEMHLYFWVSEMQTSYPYHRFHIIACWLPIPKKNHLMTMCFTCPIRFSVMFYVLPGMQNVPTYFFLVLCSLSMQFHCLWILFRPSEFYYCMIQFWTWQQCFPASMRFLMLFYHLCFQLFRFLLCLCFPPVHHRRKKKRVHRGANECVYEFSAE